MRKLKKYLVAASCLLLGFSTIYSQKPVISERPKVTTDANVPSLQFDSENEKSEEEELLERQKAEKAAAEKKAQEEAEKARAAAARRPKFYAGATGLLGVSLNSIQGVGYGFGGHFGGVFFQRLGLTLGFSTGQVKTKAAQLKAGNSTLNLNSGNTLGFLEFNLTASYVFPRISGFEIALGAGAQLISLGSPSISISNAFGPLAAVSAHYPMFSRIEIGMISTLAFSGVNSVSSGFSAYGLDSRQSLMALNFLVSIRFQLQ